MTDASRIRLASQSDNEALLDLAHRSPQGDRLVVGADRRPDFFRRSLPYRPAAVFVLEDGEGIAATVSCGMKRVLVGGLEHTAAYIFDLAVDGRARGRGYAVALLARAEAWARDNGADFLFAHVVAGNRGGLASFAASGYRDVLRLVSRILPPRRGAVSGDDGDRAIDDADWEDVARLLRASAETYDLVRAQDAAGLRALWERLPGFDTNSVWVHGRPATAVLGLWDYSSVNRTMVMRAPVALRAVMGVLSALRAARLPLPPVPMLGRPFRYGLLLGGAGDTVALRKLFGRALSRAAERGLDGLVFFHDPRLRPQWLRGVSLAARYHLVAKLLHPGPADSLGQRPVWVDPADL